MYELLDLLGRLPKPVKTLGLVFLLMPLCLVIARAAGFGHLWWAVIGGLIVIALLVAAYDAFIKKGDKARGGAFVVPVRATLTASVANGVPVFAIEDVGLGRTPLPTFVRDQVIQQANAALDLSAYDLGVTLQSLTLGDHLVTIVGTIN